MTHYEGILISSNEVINASAAGAEINQNILYLRIYHPSDTSRNLEINSRFTFSLTKNIYLFYLASLTGHNEPKTSELGKEGLLEEDGYYFPKEATLTYFCKVINIEKKEGKDRYGNYSLKRITAEVESKMGRKEYLTRENPYLDSMVYASRIPVAGKEQTEKIKNKVKKILKNKNTKLSKKIISYVEGEST